MTDPRPPRLPRPPPTLVPPPRPDHEPFPLSRTPPSGTPWRATVLPPPLPRPGTALPDTAERDTEPDPVPPPLPRQRPGRRRWRLAGLVLVLAGLPVLGAVLVASWPAYAALVGAALRALGLR